MNWYWKKKLDVDHSSEFNSDIDVASWNFICIRKSGKDVFSARFKNKKLTCFTKKNVGVSFTQHKICDYCKSMAKNDLASLVKYIGDLEKPATV